MTSSPSTDPRAPRDPRAPDAPSGPRPRAASRWLELLLVVAGGVLYFLGFVGFDIYPLEWICFVPALAALRAVSPRRALLLGTLFGLVTNLGGYYWVVHLLKAFATLPMPLALLGYVLLCLYQGFLLAIVLGLVHRAKARLGIAPVWSLAVAFPALELTYPLLFPSYIGNSQYLFTAITQFVEVTGMLGLTALIALVNGGIYELVEARLEGRGIVRPRVLVPAGLFAAALVFGLVRLPQVDARTAGARKMNVAIVQTNQGAADKHLHAAEFIRRHQEMSKELVASHPEVELIVWPESAYNGAIPRSTKNLRSLVTEGIDRPVIFGAITYTEGPSGGFREIYNTAVATAANGDVLGFYDKVKLLAFGETIPFSDVIPGLRALFPFFHPFTYGSTFEHLKAPGATLLPMICYEDIIPSLVRRIWSNAGPPNALVNVTNDSWYGDTHEPLIHLVLASFRSIETRRALIRSTNTGISAFVDPAGRLERMTGQWTKEVLIDSVPLFDDGETTVYMATGDVLGWASVLLVAFGLVRSRKASRDPSETATEPKAEAPVSGSGRRRRR